MTPLRVAACGLVALLTLGLGSVGAAAQDSTGSQGDAPPTVALPPEMVPLPNSGREPQSAGDPGGVAQYGVLVGMAVGLTLIVLLVTRESRKKKGSGTPQVPQD